MQNADPSESLLYSGVACTESKKSYKMGSVSSFWCHICACKFMPSYIYEAIFRVGRGVGDYLKYSPVAAKIHIKLIATFALCHIGWHQLPVN